jgi:hypothetical protein
LAARLTRLVIKVVRLPSALILESLFNGKKGRVVKKSLFNFQDHVARLVRGNDSTEAATVEGIIVACLGYSFLGRFVRTSYL